MADVIPFPGRRPPPKSGSTLCKRGFHKWVADKTRPFDVKQGKLVTRYRCERCGVTRTEA